MSTDDPKLTAYALGELDSLTDDERKEIDAAIAASAELRVFVEEAAAFAQMLSGAFGSEMPVVELEPAERAALIEKAAAQTARRFSARKIVWITGIAAIAATLVFVPVIAFQANQSSRSGASRQVFAMNGLKSHAAKEFTFHMQVDTAPSGTPATDEPPHLAQLYALVENRSSLTPPGNLTSGHTRTASRALTAFKPFRQDAPLVVKALPEAPKLMAKAEAAAKKDAAAQRDGTRVGSIDDRPIVTAAISNFVTADEMGPQKATAGAASPQRTRAMGTSSYSLAGGHSLDLSAMAPVHLRMDSPATKQQGGPAETSVDLGAMPLIARRSAAISGYIALSPVIRSADRTEHRAPIKSVPLSAQPVALPAGSEASFPDLPPFTINLGVVPQKPALLEEQSSLTTAP